MDTDHCDLEESGMFIQLTDALGHKEVLAPRRRENFFHNFLIPLIDFVRPVSLMSKEDKSH